MKNWESPFSLPGGRSTLGYMPCAIKKTLLFLLTFTERPPFLSNLTQWPFIFNKLLALKDPDTSLSLKDPSFSPLNSQTSDNFPQKNRIFQKFNKLDETLRNFWPWKPLFWYISLKDPIFLCAFVTERPLFLMQFVTERPLHLRCLVGTPTSLSYMSTPPGLIAPPPPDRLGWLHYCVRTSTWVC